MMAMPQRLVTSCWLVLLAAVVSNSQVVLSRPKPLAKGIADVKARIARDQQLVDDLKRAVSEHVENIGEDIYAAYGQQQDPGRLLVELKKAYEDVHNAVQDGVTGQVWPAVGQLGQALLDCMSDSECIPFAQQYSAAQQALKGVDILQQVGWESARLKTTLSELDAYSEAISRDTNIEQSLEEKSAEIQAEGNDDAGNSASDVSQPTTDEPIVPAPTPPVDLSALDDAVLINRWLDLGNRAFVDKSEEERFYAKFPAFQKFRTVAENGSPITEVTKSGAACTADWSAFYAAQTPGAMLAAAVAAASQQDACESRKAPH